MSDCNQEITTVEFAITAQNEKESQAMFQICRPKEGDLIQSEHDGPHYKYTGNQILYLSDLHLDNIVAASKCKSSDDVRNVLQRIGQELNKSYEEYLSGLSDGNAVVVIGGDITHSPRLFKMFSSMRFRFMEKAIIILGNHELWAYPGLSVAEIVAKYSELSKVPVVQDEIILFEDNIYDNSFVSKYVFYRPKRISYEAALKMSAAELSEQMYSARMIMLAGIGFSAYNKEFNADNGIYRSTLKRDQEILESKKFEVLYDRFIESTKTLKDRVLAVVTHMPLENWKSVPVYEDGIIYISGHTHRNYFHDDGMQRIYADNQNGYYGRHPSFKCVYTEDIYDPFSSYSDGVYEISKIDYIRFYRAKKMKMQLNRQFRSLFMLKKKGYYCFLARLASGKLAILNGGNVLSLSVKNIEFYYEKMDKMITRLSSPLEQYINIQKNVSEAVKSFGGTGQIHGCIVDIDFYNHVYINPIDLTIKGYYALDMIMKWVYDSIPLMLEEHSPELFKNYQHMLDFGSANALVPLLTEHTSAIHNGIEYLETDIYNASREISKMQKLTNNVLCYWNEGYLDPVDRYIAPLQNKSQRPKLTADTQIEPKKSVKDKYLGMVRKMNCGLSATVIGYKDCKNLTIQFENGVIKQGVRSDHFMNGKVSPTM